MKRLFPAALLVVCSLALVHAQSSNLTVVSYGPEGEIEGLGEANEIRVVFSEPMVAIGRVPDKVAVPYVRITPAIPGAYRWSGTTTLIFTPDAKRPLPYATSYEVTVDASATAISGRKLAKPVSFRFTTPTVKLLGAEWYRRDGTSAGPMVVLLRFNQPVRSADIAAALTARLEPHPFTPPVFSPAALARLKASAPQAIEQFNAKVKTTQTIARSTAPVTLRPTTDWDKKQYPASPELVAFEALQVLPESHVELRLAPTVRSPAGPATPGVRQEQTIRAEPAFFVLGFKCTTQCDGDSRNPIELRGQVRAADLTKATTVVDAGNGNRPVARRKEAAPRGGDELDYDGYLTIEDAGYDPQPPNSRYAVTMSPELKSVDGQTLGYTWAGVVENWHARAFTSFGDGHGVWEKDGGAQLPFYARNITSVTQWAQPIRPADLMPLLLEQQEQRFHLTPRTGGTERKLAGPVDRILSHGIDMAKALQNGVGLVWASIAEGEPIARSRYAAEGDSHRFKSTVVQVTNLGITVKDSPQNTLIFVTRLDNGAPVSNARVAIVRTDNSTFWRGTTNNDGVAIAPDTRIRTSEWKFEFIVTAEKDGDVAYVGSDWNEGISPWEFGTGVDLDESVPLLRGSVFSDRGVYRLGEEIQLKAILRHNTPQGVRLLPADTAVYVAVRDSQDRIVDERTVRVNNWSSAEWKMTLPKDGALGDYWVKAVLESDRYKPSGKEEDRQTDEFYADWGKAVRGTFLVAAYRRPDFRVDVTLAGGSAIAGDALKGNISARYLFGSPMGMRPVTWKFTRSPIFEAPSAITERFAADRWAFVGHPEEDEVHQSGEVRGEEAVLTKDGQLALQLDTPRDAGVPYSYELQGDVEDVSRQHIANRASITVHPAPWYIGVRRPSSYFVEQKAGYRTEVVAAGLDGLAVAGVPVELTLTQVQWTSVRRAEGAGFYTWETERKLVPAGSFKVTTRGEPVPLDIPLPGGGYYVLEARAKSDDGRSTVTRTSFYVLGAGYTAWERYDHNRIQLTPERQTYKPGETARIMVQSPWERATALVTTEREGIRTHRQFTLTSTQESISVPITEADVPNVFVSIVLVKGRTSAALTPASVAEKPDADVSDPGKPSFRMGYVELKVEDRTKRLTVAVAANREEFRPASPASVRVDVKDHQGRGVASEVTLWAVDYGVLSLTSYQPPDVASDVYTRKALQVLNADSRQRIISRRVLTPKGETEGGGGGSDPGAGTLRKDFRVLAFWLGSVTTGADGRASVDVKLPESLTTYRIMAVAADRSSRFGSGSAEVRTNKPLTLKPAFPRFMAVGDRAFFGAVVGSQLANGGTATVTMRSLDPAILSFAGGAEQQVTLAPGATQEVRFEAAARAVGNARIQMNVRMGSETDAFEDVIPVEVLVSPETVAAYGEAAGASTTARETLSLPQGVVPGFGGLKVELASTALVGLGEGARYLVEYPYGCAEQKASRALALLLAADLGDAFSLPGIDVAKAKPAVQDTIRELETFQCSEGGFAYWAGKCETRSPYLSAYILHVLQTAAGLGYQVNRSMRERGLQYLEQSLNTEQPQNEAWRPAYTAWQAFAIKVLVEGGRGQDSAITRLYAQRERMPIFALSYLHDALVARKETTGARITEIRRRLNNAILPEAGSAHVGELDDPYLLWLWSSNVRSTAIVLNSLVKSAAPGAAAPPNAREMVRWLMQARQNGRWGNTQENAYAMEALVNYYRRFEPDVPSFRAIVRLGEQELASEEFKGRSAESTTKDVPLDQLSSQGGATTRPLTFTREGTGTLYYTTRLRYALDGSALAAADNGLRVERRYEPFAETGQKPAATAYKAGDLVRVTLTFHVTKERRFVAVTDPLPAGFEAVESWFSTTAQELAAAQDRQRSSDAGEEGSDDWAWWRRGGFDHIERHDDRIQLFATRLGQGAHEFSYIVRATTAGTFRTAPARAEEMYSPEIFGRSPSATIEVKR